MEGQASQAGWTSWLDKLARELARENLARNRRTKLAGQNWLERTDRELARENWAKGTGERSRPGKPASQGTGWRELGGTGWRELASQADQASSPDEN